MQKDFYDLKADLDSLKTYPKYIRDIIDDCRDIIKDDVIIIELENTMPKYDRFKDNIIRNIVKEYSEAFEELPADSIVIIRATKKVAVAGKAQHDILNILGFCSVAIRLNEDVYVLQKNYGADYCKIALSVVLDFFEKYDTIGGYKIE